jgi:hypothetical protein
VRGLSRVCADALRSSLSDRELRATHCTRDPLSAALSPDTARSGGQLAPTAAEQLDALAAARVFDRKTPGQPRFSA